MNRPTQTLAARRSFLRATMVYCLLLLTADCSLLTREAIALSPKEIFRKTAPAVVLILSYDLQEGGSAARRQESGAAEGQYAGTGGSGCVIDARGRILTNAHVVINSDTGRPFSVINVYLKPERVTGDPEADLHDPILARVLRYDEKLDLAILNLDLLPADRTPLELSDPSPVESGDFVVAIGHPEQGGLWSITTGIISSKVAALEGIKGKHAFQTDASINRGNSGGPLLDEDGRVIGINTLVVREAPDGGIITDVNFAVQSDVIKKWIDKQGMDVAYNWHEAPTGTAGAATRRIKVAPMGARVLGASKPFSFDQLISTARRTYDDSARRPRSGAEGSTQQKGTLAE